MATCPVKTIDDLAKRAALTQADLQRLAAAGALASLAGHRSNAHWHAAGAKYDPDSTVPAPAGSYVIHRAKGIHTTTGRDAAQLNPQDYF